MNLSTNYKQATAEQLRQHQNLLQAHQQQLRSLAQLQQHLQHPATAAAAARMAFPFSPQLTSKQAAELQRQYLLDMIPRSMPGGGSSGAAGNSMLWRT